MPRLKKQKINPKWSMRTLRRKQRDAAEVTCHRLMIMMHLGLIDVPLEDATEAKNWRGYLCGDEAGEAGLGLFSDIEFTIRDRERAK